MSPQQGIGGRHRRRRERALVLTAVPVAVALAWGSATAHAAPQDFVTAPDTAQSGTTDTTPDAPPPTPTQERQFLPGYQPSPRVQQSEWRSYDDYQSGNQQSSYQVTYYEQTPTPQAEPTEAPPALQAAPPPAPTMQRTVIAPIDAPDGYILAGGTLVPYDPNLLDPTLVEQFNNSAAALQADGGNFLVDAGFADAPQADRIAAGTATGIMVGGLTGLGASMVPAIAITATGAAIGGALGFAAVSAGAVAVLPAGPIGFIFVPGAAALAGAGVGAALSAPIVVALTATGAVLGGVLGGTLLGGEQQIIEEPAPPPAPESNPVLPAAPLTLDAPGIQSVIDTTVGQIDDALTQAPAVGLDAGSVWTEPAYEQVQQFTTTVLEQPAVADAVATVTTAAAPVLDQANAALAGLNLAI